MEYKIHELTLAAYTTKDISKPKYLKALINHIKGLYRLDDLIVRYVKAGSDDVREVRLSETTPEEILSLSQEELKDEYHGSFILSDLQQNQFEVGYDWRKVYRGRWERYISTSGFPENKVTLGFRFHEINDPSYVAMLVEFCRQLADSMEVHYLCVFHPKNDGGIFLGKWGLSAGLPGIYWMNVYGRPFVEIIGESTLLAAPASKVLKSGQDKIFIQITQEYCDASKATCIAAFAKVRNHIGEEYFAKSVKPSYTLPSGAYSMFSISNIRKIVKWVLAVGKDFKNPARKADVCPNIDWTDMQI